MAGSSLRTNRLDAERDGTREGEREAKRSRTFVSLANKFILKAMGSNGMKEF